MLANLFSAVVVSLPLMYAYAQIRASKMRKARIADFYKEKH